jgi:hypothetical protein
MQMDRARRTLELPRAFAHGALQPPREVIRDRRESVARDVPLEAIAKRDSRHAVPRLHPSLSSAPPR